MAEENTPRLPDEESAPPDHVDALTNDSADAGHRTEEISTGESPVATPDAGVQHPPPRRVAVATNDGENINECFGRAWSYRIYELGNGGFRLAEIRPGPTPCRDGSHDEAALAAAVNLLADCQVVLAARIGPGALRLLADKGVNAYPLRASISGALRKLYEQTSRRQPGKGRMKRHCCGFSKEE